MMDYEERADGMDFMRFGDCIIANLSLQEYYSRHGPTIALVFMVSLSYCFFFFFKEGINIIIC